MRRRSSSSLSPAAEKWAGEPAATAGLAAALGRAVVAGFAAGLLVWADTCTASERKTERTGTRMALLLLAGCNLRHGPGSCQDSITRRYSNVEWMGWRLLNSLM